MVERALKDFEEMAELRYVFGTKRNPIVVHLGEYEGRPRVDIRKHYPSKEDTEELLPTRKGIFLNHSQLEQLLDIVNSKKETIDDFFHGKHIDSINQTFLEEIPLVGRSFNVQFKNGETKVSIGSELSHLKNRTSDELIPQLLEAFYRSALDAIEDSDDFNMLMNRLNFFLKRI